MLLTPIDDSHKTWDTVLHYMTFFHNVAVGDMTGFTVFRHVHGRETTMTLYTLQHHSGDDGDDNDGAVAA